jgi:hypothetical protein
MHGPLNVKFKLVILQSCPDIIGEVLYRKSPGRYSSRVTAHLTRTCRTSLQHVTRIFLAINIQQLHVKHGEALHFPFGNAQITLNNKSSSRLIMYTKIY